MARKPNYKFERLERQRAKAAKTAARREAKKEKAEKRKAENAGLLPADEDDAVLVPTDDGDVDSLGDSPVDSPGEPSGEPTGRPQDDDPNR